MNTLKILKVLVALVASVADYFKSKQLLEAGAAQAVLKGLKDADDAIARASDARGNANSVPIDKDPYDRSGK